MIGYGKGGVGSHMDYIPDYFGSVAFLYEVCGGVFFVWAPWAVTAIWGYGGEGATYGKSFPCG